ncbi:hypothetical protein C1646_668537 [Rhizophagus diaphanus]|nr:hypothetical protein C1646_668537 [Rhizophagus diaphanus] [Rhizophagus sp. MUCL 43196]
MVKLGKILFEIIRISVVIIFLLVNRLHQCVARRLVEFVELEALRGYSLRKLPVRLKTCEASTSSQSRKPPQSCEDTSSQSCDDIRNEAEDDDFDEPKSVNLRKRKRKCTIQ